MSSSRRLIFAMLLLTFSSTTRTLLFRRKQSSTRFSSIFAAAAGANPNSISTCKAAPDNGNNNQRTTVILRAVQVIHRHGDRSPITPMKDEAFWTKTLVPVQVAEQIAVGTRLIRNQHSAETTTTSIPHGAQGRGPFGKLTELGLWQMIRVGNALREQYVAPHHHHHTTTTTTTTTDNESDSTTTTTTATTTTDSNDNHLVGGGGSSSSSSMVAEGPYYTYLWHPQQQRPLHPRTIRVISTDFPRTIQSVQGLLVGLFPDGISNVNDNTTTTTATATAAATTTDDSATTADDSASAPAAADVIIDIDVRHSHWMIPDPQPRQTVEQEHLEVQIATSPTVQQRELELRSLAARATAALHPLLGADAHEVAFGVVQEHAGDVSIEIEPLAWNQLAELTKCLVVRDMLPPGLSVQDQQDISKHAAWLWFHTLRHKRMAYLSMHRMTSQQVEYFEQHVTANNHNDKHQNNNDNDEVLMTIWSAHDSTLIGLLCAYRLEQPAEWPEYASYLIMELMEVTTTTTPTSHNDDDENKHEKEFYVRFSLNGQHLKIQWEDDEEAMDMIPLALLRKRIDTVGSEPSTTTEVQ